MKRKYTLKELKELKDNDTLIGKDLGGGLKIEIVEFGLAFGWGIYNKGVLVYAARPFSGLDLGILRALNGLLKEINNEV